MKKLLMLLLCCLPIASAIAGGAKESQPVTVRFTVAFDTPRFKYYENAMSEFKTKNPNINVVLQNESWTEFWAKLRAQTASKTEPDVWLYVQTFGDEWLDKGLLMPLDDYISKAKDMNMSDFVETALKGMTKGGKLYGLPYEGGSTVFTFLNVDLFKQAGIPLPTNDWTWDDAKRIAKEIMAKVPTVNGGKVYGFGQRMPDGEWQTANYLGSWGAPFITNDADGPKYLLDDPKSIEAMQWIYDLHAKDKICAPIDETPPNDWTLWLNGRIPILFHGAWSIPTWLEGCKFKWDMIPFPKGPGGRNVVSIGGYFVISKSTKVPQQAFEVLKFITSAEQNNNIVGKSGAGIPAHKSGFQYMSNELQRAAKIMFIDSSPIVSFAGLPGIYETQSKEFDLGMLGQKSAAEIAKVCAEKARQIIKENYGK